MAQRTRAAIEWSAVVAAVALVVTLIVTLIGQRIDDTNRRIDDTNRQFKASREAIEANRRAIEANRRAIEANRQAIEANRRRIDERFDALQALILEALEARRPTSRGGVPEPLERRGQPLRLPAPPATRFQAPAPTPPGEAAAALRNATPRSARTCAPARA